MRHQFRILTRTLSLALMLALALCFAGCAKSSDSSTPPYTGGDPMPGSPDPARPGGQLDSPNYF